MLQIFAARTIKDFALKPNHNPVVLIGIVLDDVLQPCNYVKEGKVVEIINVVYRRS